MKENLLVQTLSHLFHSSTSLDVSSSTKIDIKDEDDAKDIANGEIKAKGEWCAAITALEKLLLKIISPQLNLSQGLILSSAAPILSHESLINKFESGIFTTEACKNLSISSFKLPGSGNSHDCDILPTITELPLFPTDPLIEEKFSLIFTPYFGLLMVLGKDEEGIPRFYFSFDPESLYKGWDILRSRLLFTRHPQLSQVDEWVDKFKVPKPDYRLITEFTQNLLKYLPNHSITKEKTIVEFPEENITLNNCNSQTSEIPEKNKNIVNNSDIELLQALTHEIRTPLTTIRTLTKLLLKRKDLHEKALKHLEVIDQECTEQINRMELIFKAAEFESKPSNNKQVYLTSISLEQVFKESIPRWKKQAQRRNVNLDIILPKQLPNVVSDPAMLDQMLTGLMEKITRSVPNGGNIKVQITTAGNQLKLQMLSQYPYENNPLKALGNLLMFQPETGSLTLNLDVTKNLFQALGGKLIVRQKPEFGEVLTVFLPLMIKK